jgi:hypothetical protein
MLRPWRWLASVEHYVESLKDPFESLDEYWPPGAQAVPRDLAAPWRL